MQYRPQLSNLPVVVKNLLIINVIMFLGVFLIDDKLPFNLNHFFSLYFFKSEFFKPHQFITHMFMHGGIGHLFFNMFALFMFGRILESVWGPKRFLMYYLITGIGAALIHSFANWLDYISMKNALDAFINTPSPDLLSTFVQEHVGSVRPWVYDFINKWAEYPNDAGLSNQAIELAQRMLEGSVNTPTVGASGAVFGILLAFGMLFPNTELMLLFPPIPIKAKYFVIGYGAIEMYLAFQNNPNDNIAHLAHLGGMIFGFVLIKYWQKRSKHFY